MRDLPNWVESREECPLDGCEGQFYNDVTGSWHHPKHKRRSTCRHTIEECCICYRSVALENATRYEWSIVAMADGIYENASLHFCDGCHNRRNVFEKVPDYALDKSYVRKLPGGQS